MVFDVGKAKKDFEAGRVFSDASASARGFIPPVGLVHPAKDLLRTSGVLAGAQARAAAVGERMEGILGNPVVKSFLSMPPKPVIEPQADRIFPLWQTAAGGVGPRVSTLTGITQLLGGAPPQTGAVGKIGPLTGVPRPGAQGWWALGPYGDRAGDRHRSFIPQIFAGYKPATGPSLAGAQRPLLGPGIGELLGAHRPPASAINPFGSPALDGAKRIIEGYLGVSRSLEKLVAGWSRPVEGLFQHIKRALDFYPKDSEGQPIPFWNVRLYLLARAAYYGDNYAAKARFLDEIGADRRSADDVLFIGDLLGPTFDPKRPDLRTDWWLLDPLTARGWLRGRLADRNFEARENDRARRGRELSYTEAENPDDPNDPYPYVTKHAPRLVSAEAHFFEDERAAMLLQELAAVLPPGQYRVVVLVLRGWTYREIGRELGIAEGTVKSHVARIRKCPEVSEILLSGSALRSNGARSRKRPHRK